MLINFSRSFAKCYEKSPIKIRASFNQKLKLFVKNPHHPLLNNHPLKGKLKGYKSINVTGDWRALYSQTGQSTVTFEALGTHSQLYG